jgi:hypothetical protein
MSEPGRVGGQWKRSARCADSNCAEVSLPAGDEPGAVLIRASGDPATILSFAPAVWAAFVAGVKRGEFDR